jgi:FkbM family methyltransferase
MNGRLDSPLLDPGNRSDSICELASEGSVKDNGRQHERDCWPASHRDWLTAHSLIRLGRFDRFSGIRRSRNRLVAALAREDSSIRFGTRFGFDVYLPASYRGFVNMALCGVLFHSTLIAVAKGVIRPGDVVVDGGTNVGVFALLAATVLKGNGRVFAFEPEPNTCSLLRRNIRWNGFDDVIQAEQQALADNDGICDFGVDWEEPMLSSLVSSRPNSSRTIQVRSVRLDNFLAASGLTRVDVVKLDLEGGEPACIRGMQESIRYARCLILEVDQPRLEKQAIRPLEFVEQVRDMGGFSVVEVCDEQQAKLAPWENGDGVKHLLSKFGYANIVLHRGLCE